jgi:hypothetical protein
LKGKKKSLRVKMKVRRERKRKREVILVLSLRMNRWSWSVTEKTARNGVMKDVVNGKTSVKGRIGCQRMV